jgi:hypothetical protein
VKNQNREFVAQMPVQVELNLNDFCRLGLYARLSNQTQEQAAQQIIAEFLATIGNVRIQHWMEREIEDIDALAAAKHAKPVARKLSKTRSFRQRITSVDRIRARGMGIRLD